MTGRSNKSAAIRSALADGRELTLNELLERMEEDLQQIVSKARLRTLLSVMQVHGEIFAKGRGDNRKYGLMDAVLPKAAGGRG